MAYSKAVREKAKRLYLQGWSCNEIAGKLGINPDTVFRWRAREEWGSPGDDTLDGVRRQIASIAASDEPLTDAQAHKIDKLTRAVERLERSAQRGERQRRGKKGQPPSGLEPQIIGSLRDKALDILYPYQRAFFLDTARFRLCRKSRQTGFSFLLGLENLFGAVERGTDQIVVSASQPQSDIVRTYAQNWCRTLGVDYLEDGGNIIFPGGSRGIYLPCNPRTVQGYSGDVYLDEFAWHQRSRLMWQTVVPVITVGKKRLTVTSSPYTETDMFGELCLDQAKYPRFSRHLVTIHDAIRDGLQADIAELRDLFDAVSFAQAYECKFFADELSLFTPDELRAVFDDGVLGATSGWVNGGYDVGRFRDVSALVLAEQTRQDGEKAVHVRHMETLDRMAFEGQKTHLSGILEGWKIRRLAMDATGIGANLAEDMQRLYPGKIERVVFTREKKEAMALGVKHLVERRELRIPPDRDLVLQLHSIKRKPTERGFTYDAERTEQIKHADLFWALALAVKDFGTRRRLLTSGSVRIAG